MLVRPLSPKLTNLFTSACFTLLHFASCLRNRGPVGPGRTANSYIPFRAEKCDPVKTVKDFRNTVEIRIVLLESEETGVPVSRFSISVVLLF